MIEKYGITFEEHEAPYCVGELVVIDRNETYTATYRAKTQLFMRTLTRGQFAQALFHANATLLAEGRLPESERIRRCKERWLEERRACLENWAKHEARNRIKVQGRARADCRLC